MLEWVEQVFVFNFRVPLIRDGILEGQQSNNNNKSFLLGPKPLDNYKILDVGCGGGILSEPLGRLGAHVLGLDPGQENISVAELHLQQTSPHLLNTVSYKCQTIEHYVNSKMPATFFDGVVSSETIEHVENPELFLKMMGQCVKV